MTDLTKEQIASLEDFLARNVMEWHKGNYGELWRNKDHWGTVPYAGWHPYTDPAQAIQCAEKAAGWDISKHYGEPPLRRGEPPFEARVYVKTHQLMGLDVRKLWYEARREKAHTFAAALSVAVARAFGWEDGVGGIDG